MVKNKLKLNLDLHLSLSMNDIYDYDVVGSNEDEKYVLPEKYLSMIESKAKKHIKKKLPFSERYDFEIIENKDGSIRIRKNGYDYVILKSHAGKFSFGMKSMTDESKIKFMNNNSLLNTDLRAVSIDKPNGELLINIINTKTKETSICRNSTNPNIKRLTSQTTKKSRYLDRIKNSLGDFYDYSKTECNYTYDKATVTCPIHGDFEIIVSNTIYAGCGCPRCTGFGFGKSQFINRCIDKQLTAKLYFIKCFNENEEFYKIGITSKDIEYRIKQMPYNAEVILSISDDPDLIYDLEKILHDKYFKNKYLPLINFNGKTECFKFENESNIIETILFEKRNLKDL